MTFRPLFHHDRNAPRRGWSLPTRRRAAPDHDDSLRAGAPSHRAPTSLTALANGGVAPR